MNLGESTPITAVQDKEVVLTSTTGHTFRMKVTDLAESVRQLMPVATDNMNGLMSISDFRQKSRFKLPITSDRAIHIANFNMKLNGYYNVSILVRLDSYQQSVFGIIGPNRTAGNISSYVKLIGVQSGYGYIYHKQ